MTDPIQAGMLGVQVLAFAGLVWYTVETRRIRKASQEQVRVSQDLIRAAMDQVEGLSKPCITLWSDIRDAQEAIADRHGVGNLQARLDQGSFVLHNIGNGAALNISYRMERPERTARSRYVPNLLSGQKASMPEPATAYNGEVNMTIEYQSIGGRRYRSIVNMNSRVLTAFRFEEQTAPLTE